jgi:CHAD domain-containing protein
VPPAVTARDAAHETIARQVRELRRQMRLVVRKGSPDPVHDMRVATRRLRAALGIFRGVAVLPSPARRRRLRWLARQLGQVRDLDARTALLAEQYLPHVVGAEAARVGGLLADLAERRARAYSRLRRGLRRGRSRRLGKALAAWVKKPAFAGEVDAGAARFMVEAVDVAAQRVSGHEAMREARPPAEALHNLRIAVKWLRYTLDFHGETCGLTYDVERTLAHELQDCLGELRDHDLLLAALAEQGAGGPWTQLMARVTAGRRRLWRRFLELRRRWRIRTRPAQTVATLEGPRFVNLEVTPVRLRLVTTSAVSPQPSAIRERRRLARC